MLECVFFKKLRDFDLNVSISVNSGEITVLKGDNGSGKTTILRMIAGLLDPDVGYVKIDGNTVFDTDGNIDYSVQSRKIGYILQNPMVFPHMTVRKNAEYGICKCGLTQDEIERKVNKWFEIFKISEYADFLASELSGGQKQRVALVRAFVTKPKLLLMDEPFTGLDNETREIVKENVYRYVKEWNIPCLLVSHYENEISGILSVCLHLSRGKIINSH